MPKDLKYYRRPGKRVAGIISGLLDKLKKDKKKDKKEKKGKKVNLGLSIKYVDKPSPSLSSMREMSEMTKGKTGSAKVADTPAVARIKARKLDARSGKDLTQTEVDIRKKKKKKMAKDFKYYKNLLNMNKRY